jgi:hypothetical protein
MSVKLKEDLALSAPQSSGNKWRIKVIQAGWGSSGYYGEDMLKEYGPGVFSAGTKVFMNHPSATESSDRPERDVHQLAGKLISDAIFMEDGLFADVEFYSHYAPIIREMSGDVGLSIHALGEATTGEAEGREGPIIESLVADPLTSVDVVTVAGAGGKFISLLESYKREDSLAEVEESATEGNGMSITKEELDAAVTAIQEAFVEAISPLREQVSVLVEAATPAETDTVEDAEPALDPVDVAEKFNESGLPKIALQRVSEVLKSETNIKTVEELLDDEKAYADSIRESIVVPAAEFVGVVHEAGKSSTPANELDSIVTRIASPRK